MRPYRLIGRPACSTCLLSALLCPFTPGTNADTVLAHAEQQLAIVRAQSAPGQPDVPKITIKLIQVIPQTGNNPLHTQEPIENRNGQVVKDESPPDRDVPPAAEPAFTARSAGYGQPVPDIGVVSLVRSADGKWQLQSGDPHSPDAIVIQLSPGDPGVVSVHPSVQNSNFSIVGGNPFLQFPADGQARMFDVRHLPTGHVYRIRFQADTTLAGKVTVSSVARL